MIRKSVTQSVLSLSTSLSSAECNKPSTGRNKEGVEVPVGLLYFLAFAMYAKHAVREKPIPYLKCAHKT